MQNITRRAALAASVVTVFAAGAIAAESSSKFDPKKPLKGSEESQAQPGKAADAKVSGDDVKNATVATQGTRAGPYSCDIHIDNRTNWVIHRVYIDGRNWGTVGRYGDSVARDVAAGATRVYAEADFTDGSTRHWGPRVFNCNSYGRYTWTIR
jgi:hypothetical protein